MHAEVVGDVGLPNLVLLHGGLGAGRYHWAKVVATAKQQFRVHLPDLPGHGRTPLPPDRPYDRDLLVDAVAAYMDALEGPVHAGGFSMGGHALLALLTRGSHLPASLALIGVNVRDHPGLHTWRARFEPDRFAAASPEWARSLSRLHEPQGGPEAWRDVARRDSAGSLDVTVDLEMLRPVVTPTLLVRGDRDEAVEPAQYADLRATWPHADELVVPHGGHDVQVTRWRLVVTALEDFWARAALR